jgi:hypothetical protein
MERDSKMTLKRIDLVYGICPVLMFSTDSMPDWMGGVNYGPICKIRPKYFEKNDIGIQEHEKMHAKQWYRSLFTMGIFYLLSDTSRFNYETEAYRVQLKCYGMTTPPDWMVESIMTKYKLNVTKEQVLAALKG